MVIVTVTWFWFLVSNQESVLVHLGGHPVRMSHSDTWTVGYDDKRSPLATVKAWIPQQTSAPRDR